MLVTVDFTQEEENALLDKMRLSEAPDIATLVKAAVHSFNPNEKELAARIAPEAGDNPQSPAQKAQAEEAAKAEDAKRNEQAQQEQH